jgi:hypothetical protein
MQIDHSRKYCPRGCIASTKLEVPRNFQHNSRKPNHGGLTYMPWSTLVLKADQVSEALALILKWRRPMVQEDFKA